MILIVGMLGCGRSELFPASRPTFFKEIKMEETMAKLKALQQLAMPPNIASVVDDIIIRADAEFSALNGISDWNGSAISASRVGSVFDYDWWFR